MRCLRFFILVTLLHDIFGLHQFLPSGRSGGQAAFIYIDVCSTFSADTETDDEAAFVSDARDDAMPHPTILAGAAAGSPLTEFLLINQEERPPKT